MKINRADAENPAYAEAAGDLFRIRFNKLQDVCLIKRIGEEWQLVGEE